MRDVRLLSLMGAALCIQFSLSLPLALCCLIIFGKNWNAVNEWIYKNDNLGLEPISISGNLEFIQFLKGMSNYAN